VAIVFKSKLNRIVDRSGLVALSTIVTDNYFAMRLDLDNKHNCNFSLQRNHDCQGTLLFILLQMETAGEQFVAPPDFDNVGQGPESSPESINVKSHLTPEFTMTLWDNKYVELSDNIVTLFDADTGVATNISTTSWPKAKVWTLESIKDIVQQSGRKDWILFMRQVLRNVSLKHSNLKPPVLKHFRSSHRMNAIANLCSDGLLMSGVNWKKST
jgi:hypothetical protein